VNLSIIEGQKIKGFYNHTKDIIDILLDKEHWVSFFCQWLFRVLKMIGYQIDYKNKKEYKYFNLITQEFENIIHENSINFPHNLLNNSKTINLKEINSIFTIFESIYCKNHLNNMNYKMPINFINFKKSFLRYLKETKNA
jgi:hypothetical protein